MCNNCNSDPFGFESLDHEPSARAPVVQEEATTPSGERFACEHCGGSGRWRGGVNRNGDKQCFACKGTGYFKTSRAQRHKAKLQRQGRKAKALAASRELNAEHEDGALLAWVTNNASWNEFCRSLVEQHTAGRVWSEKQVAAVQRMRAKTEATRAEKAKARDNQTAKVDVSRIKAMFDTARENGLQRPRFHCAGMIMSLAPDNGRNAGAVYVKAGGEYMGKIMDGRFQPAYGAPADLSERINAIAADPTEAARQYGRDTGTCSCCGRQLTDPESVAAGIGPICAAKWGL